MKSGIYRITNTINGKVYIGQSKNVEQRMRKHKEMLKHNRHHNEHLQASFNKYGEDAFLFEKISECSVQELDDKEKELISTYKSNIRKFGYNIQDGGNARHGCPKETRIKISNSNKGKKRPHSETQKRHMSENWHKTHKPLTHEQIQRSLETRKNNLSLDGENNGNALITNKEAEKIIKRLHNGENPYRMAEETGISKNVILNLLYNKSYKHILPEIREDLANSIKNKYDSRLKKAIELYDKGFSQNQIALQLNISRNTLRKELLRSGVDTNANNPFRKAVNA